MHFSVLHRLPPGMLTCCRDHVGFNAGAASGFTAPTGAPSAAGYSPKPTAAAGMTPTGQRLPSSSSPTAGPTAGQRPTRHAGQQAAPTAVMGVPPAGSIIPAPPVAVTLSAAQTPPISAAAFSPPQAVAALRPPQTAKDLLPPALLMLPVPPGFAPTYSPPSLDIAGLGPPVMPAVPPGLAALNPPPADPFSFSPPAAIASDAPPPGSLISASPPAGVLATPPGVLATPPGVLGTPPDMLNAPPASSPDAAPQPPPAQIGPATAVTVLGSMPLVDGAVADMQASFEAATGFRRSNRRLLQARCDLRQADVGCCSDIAGQPDSIWTSYTGFRWLKLHQYLSIEELLPRRLIGRSVTVLPWLSPQSFANFAVTERIVSMQPQI